MMFDNEYYPVRMRVPAGGSRVCVVPYLVVCSPVRQVVSVNCVNYLSSITYPELNQGGLLADEILIEKTPIQMNGRSIESRND